MDFSEVNITQLVQETFQVSRVVQSDRLKGERQSLTVPGLIYSLQSGASTFSLRGIACESMERTLSDVESSHQMQRALNISDYYPLEELQHYQTANKLEGEVIIDHLCNRRFPYHEDSLCNLSDPGFSWWMKHDEDSLSIYFKSFGIDRAENLVQLGPIADTAISIAHLQEISKYLDSLFPVAEIFCSPKQFTVMTKDKGSECFNAFKQLFLSGDWGETDSSLRFNSLPKTLSLFLSEVAVVRKFWLHLKQQQARSKRRAQADLLQ
jgi:hypothetical protein